MKFNWYSENLIKLKKILCIITIIGMAQFLFLTFLAAFFYPGGYNYFNYYFSDLGSSVARNGVTNSISSKLFILSLIIIAICLIPFWLITHSLFNNKIESIFGKFGSILGLLSTPSIITIALCPMDTQFALHLLSSIMVLFFYTIAIFFYSIAITINKEYSKYLGFIGLVVIAVSIGLMVNPFASYGAFLQKIIFYCYFLWVLIPLFLIWKLNRIKV